LCLPRQYDADRRRRHHGSAGGNMRAGARQAMMKPVILVCRYAFGLAGLLALALAVSVHAATIAGIDVEARYPSVWLFHYGIFPLVLAAVLVVFSLAPGARFRDVVLLIPMTARILIVAVFTYAVANFFVIMP